MLTWARFIWDFRRNRFAEALARTASRGRTPEAERELWSLYRLGMYRSVSQYVTAPQGWRGRFARVVSLAACGEFDRSRLALADFYREGKWFGHRVPLADALAPFMPSDALHLIEDSGAAPAALRAALLLRNGRSDEAQLLLNTLEAETFRVQPELHLLHSNAFGGAPADRMRRLNAFLRAHGVPALRLVSESHSPAPMNVAAVEAASPVSGPLVTVLMTTFRTGSRTKAAIESLLAQSYTNLEVLIVDDASGDSTPALVRALAEREPRVRILELPRNIGTYAAKSIGLARARGEFITCHDSDDWSHPEKIARQVAPLLADRRLVCTVSSWVRIQDDGVYFARPVHPLMRLNPSSPLFRRDRVLREAGAWDCVRTGADSEFLARLRIVYGPKAIRKIRQPLALGSHRPDSLMTAASTGYSEAGISPQRLDYWEAWSRWHIETLARGQRPFIPADVRAAALARPFPVPPSLRVPVEDIEYCLKR